MPSVFKKKLQNRNMKTLENDVKVYVNIVREIEIIESERIKRWPH